MVRRGRRKTLDRHQATKYIRVARALRKSLADLETIAENGDRYGNAMGIVAVHSAIAYADALSIAYGGFKSAEGDHERSVDALKAALGARMDPDKAQQLLAIVKKKDSVSYQGEYYSVADARALVQRLEDSAAWAEDMYDRRP